MLRVPMKAMAKSCKERLRHAVICCTQKTTNAAAEGMHSKMGKKQPPGITRRSIKLAPLAQAASDLSDLATR